MRRTVMTALLCFSSSAGAGRPGRPRGPYRPGAAPRRHARARRHGARELLSRAPWRDPASGHRGRAGRLQPAREPALRPRHVPSISPPCRLRARLLSLTQAGSGADPAPGPLSRGLPRAGLRPQRAASGPARRSGCARSSPGPPGRHPPGPTFQRRPGPCGDQRAGRTLHAAPILPPRCDVALLRDRPRARGGRADRAYSGATLPSCWRRRP